MPTQPYGIIVIGPFESYDPASDGKAYRQRNSEAGKGDHFS
jgi:hypothetical protein